MTKKKPKEPGSACPTCVKAAKLPWGTLPLDVLGLLTDDMVHYFVRQIAKRFGARLGIVIAVYTQEHHSLSASSVSVEWLRELGRQLIRHADEGTLGHWPPGSAEPKRLN
jgi:hypothetical protein